MPSHEQSKKSSNSVLLALLRIVLLFIAFVIAFSLIGTTAFATFLAIALHVVVETVDVLLLKQIDRTFYFAFAVGL